jgi:hypothetical protein
VADFLILLDWAWEQYHPSAPTSTKAGVSTCQLAENSAAKPKRYRLNIKNKTKFILDFQCKIFLEVSVVVWKWANVF